MLVADHDAGDTSPGQEAGALNANHLVGNGGAGVHAQVEHADIHGLLVNVGVLIGPLLVVGRTFDRHFHLTEADRAVHYYGEPVFRRAYRYVISPIVSLAAVIIAVGELDLYSVDRHVRDRAVVPVGDGNFHLAGTTDFGDVQVDGGQDSDQSGANHHTGGVDHGYEIGALGIIIFGRVLRVCIEARTGGADLHNGSSAVHPGGAENNGVNRSRPIKDRSLSSLSSPWYRWTVAVPLELMPLPVTVTASPRSTQPGLTETELVMVILNSSSSSSPSSRVMVFIPEELGLEIPAPCLKTIW